MGAVHDIVLPGKSSSPAERADEDIGPYGMRYVDRRALGIQDRPPQGKAGRARGTMYVDRRAL